MKLFTKKRLQIKKGATATRIQWWRLGFIDIMLMVWIPMMIIWGIASANGAKEVIGIKVIEMDTIATVLYWSAVFLLLLHMAFNRRELIYIDAKWLSYRKRFFPPKRIKISIPSVKSVTIEEKEDPIAETPAAGHDIVDYFVVIGSLDYPSVRIKGLGEDDAKIVKGYIEEYMIED